MTNSISYWFKHSVMDLPFLASKHGEDVDNLIVYVHLLMGVLFVGWLAYFLYALIRFRKSKNPKADYVGVKGHASNYLEGAVALVEAVLLIGFAVPLWAKAVSDPPSEKDSTVIHIMGQQFYWMAHYAGPDGIMGKSNPALSNSSDPFGVDRQNDPGAKDDVVVMNNFYVPMSNPTRKQVLLHVTSLDVIHSFAVRSMRLCQDAIPGMSVPTWFAPTRVGQYKITCAQLCGNSHYRMAGTLNVVTQDEFDKWLAEQSAKAKTATGAVSYE